MMKRHNLNPNIGRANDREWPHDFARTQPRVWPKTLAPTGGEGKFERV
jgi:hypothetical protein